VILASGIYIVFISLRNPSQIALNEIPEGTEKGPSPEVTFSPSPVVEPSVRKVEPEKEEVAKPSPVGTPGRAGQRPTSPKKKRPSRSPIRLNERQAPVVQKPTKKADEPVPGMVPPPPASEEPIGDIPMAAAQGYPMLDYAERKNDGYVNRINVYLLDSTTDRSRLGLLDPGVPPDKEVKVFLNGDPVEVLIRLADYFLIAVPTTQLKRGEINKFELRIDEGKTYHYNLDIIK